MKSSPSSVQAQAAFSTQPGCLRRFVVPILAVLIMSTVLVLGLSKIDIAQAGTATYPSSENPVTTTGGIAPLFSPEVQAWEAQILSWSEKYALDPNLVATVMQIESCGYARARSHAGAMGLFQVMPYHFQEGEDPYNPATNAKRGLVYLKQSLQVGGTPLLALAGYNGGITGAQRPQTSWPEETHRYIYWGVAIYQDAQNGLEHSPRLEEWLSRGGASLCNMAKSQ
jgi:soluble lytic murein transglycosylase-like protein